MREVGPNIAHMQKEIDDDGVESEQEDEDEDGDDEDDDSDGEGRRRRRPDISKEDMQQLMMGTAGLKLPGATPMNT